MKNCFLLCVRGLIIAYIICCWVNVTLDIIWTHTDLSLTAHVNQLTARCYSSLRRIKSCRRALTRSASVILINSFIVSRLDYCNSLLAGCNKQLVDQLQRVLNCAARVIFGGGRRDHVTPLLRDKLHWLRAKEQITFKLCLLVYKAINGLAPSVYPCYNCLHPFRSSLCSPWRPCCLSDQATSRQPGILRCWSYGVEQLAARHSNCFVVNHIQEPTQDSLIHPVLLSNVIRVLYAVWRPCSDFMDMLRCLTNCRFLLVLLLLIKLIHSQVFMRSWQMWTVFVMLMLLFWMMGRAAHRETGIGKWTINLFEWNHNHYWKTWFKWNQKSFSKLWFESKSNHLWNHLCGKSKM